MCISIWGIICFSGYSGLVCPFSGLRIHMLTISCCFNSSFLHSISYQTHVTQTAVQSLPVIEDLYVVKQILLHFFNCTIFLPVETFLLPTGKETFHAAVVIWTSSLAHASFYVVFHQHLLVFLTAVLTSPVIVEYQPILLVSSLYQRISQRIQRKEDPKYFRSSSTILTWMTYLYKL